MTVNPGDSIQTAVKNAAAGDVILIRPGTYVESVTVNKRLTLRGEAGATVNGGITIIADGATIEGLAVNGAAGSRAIDVNWVIDAVVRGCTVSGGKYGIYIESAPNCTVEGCTLDDTITYIGIDLFGSGQCRILDNQLSGSGPIGITLGDCPDCIISGNTVQDSDFAGIKLQSGCQGSVIVANTLSNTPSGIEVMDCTGQTTVLRDNTIVGARDEGVFLVDTNSLIVENITVRGGGYGVRLSSVDTITLANSTITGTGTGFYVESTTTNSLIANNLFNNTKNIEVETALTGTRWNTTKTFGKNIRGGPYLGGNLWLTPEGTGFSETHEDRNGDGICDESYDLGKGCIDHLPLHTCIPTANFTAVPTGGSTPLTVQFTDASYGVPILSRSWDFGDNTPAVDHTRPSHTFLTNGTYLVSLTVTNAFGSDTTTQTVTALDPPTAAISVDLTEGNAPLSVQFADDSTGCVFERLWTFGDDGTTSTDAALSHTFENPGTYTVALNASNPYAWDEATVEVVVHDTPEANFTPSAEAGNAPLNVEFTDTSTGEITAWQWNFGDGNGSTEQNPSHEYVTPGTYTVELNASNAYGSDTTTSVVTVLPAPSADFTQSTDEGNAPLEVVFTDESTGDVTSWQWDFGDGNGSTEQNPSHEYVTPGTYTVELNASNAYGSDTTTSVVTVFSPPVAHFISKVGVGNDLKKVVFTDTSSGNVTAWHWAFGDGATSTEEHPVHAYEKFGTYDVTLTVQNAYETSTTNGTVTLTAPSSSGGRSPASAGTVSHIPAGGHASFEVRDSAIREVEVTTSEAVSDLLVTIEPTAKPNRIEAPAEAVYEYDEVTLYHTTDDALAGADLDFTVTKAWLEEQGAGPESVVLYRYHDDAWHALPTRMVGEDDHCYSFVAESPGFSLFAIGVDESSTPAPTLTQADPVTTLPATTAPPTPTTPAQTPLPWGCAAFAAAGAAVAT